MAKRILQVSATRFRSNIQMVIIFYDSVVGHLFPGPLLLKKTEEALLNKNFSDSVVDQVLFSLKEEWME